ncbi:hypothetical protein C8R46DRAFT_1359874 [Mycena filopes]|nr:hypothetical protein C8R46DRAFT_1359874 [Mycena filopes]
MSASLSAKLPLNPLVGFLVTGLQLASFIANKAPNIVVSSTSLRVRLEPTATIPSQINVSLTFSILLASFLLFTSLAAALVTVNSSIGQRDDKDPSGANDPPEPDDDEDEDAPLSHDADGANDGPTADGEEPPPPPPPGAASDAPHKRGHWFWRLLLWIGRNILAALRFVWTYIRSAWRFIRWFMRVSFWTSVWILTNDNITTIATHTVWYFRRPIVEKTVAFLLSTRGRGIVAYLSSFVFGSATDIVNAAGSLLVACAEGQASPEQGIALAGSLTTYLFGSGADIVHAIGTFSVAYAQDQASLEEGVELVRYLLASCGLDGQLLDCVLSFVAGQSSNKCKILISSITILVNLFLLHGSVKFIQKCLQYIGYIAEELAVMCTYTFYVAIPTCKQNFHCFVVPSEWIIGCCWFAELSTAANLLILVALPVALYFASFYLLSAFVKSFRSFKA